MTIATHEAGHATVAHLLGEDQRLEVLTIIKRQQSLGLLARSDIEERFTRTRSEMECVDRHLPRRHGGRGGLLR